MARHDSNSLKMTCASIFLCAISAISVVAQDGFSPEYRRALREGAKANVTLKVTDDTGLPVSTAHATVYFDMINQKGTIVRGVTDDKGNFSAEGLCADYAAITVTKEGYYDTRFRYDDIRSRDPERLKDGRWLPWNPTIPVVLRKVRRPIPMYATSIEKHSIPSGTDMGFDCVKQDWVAPHGKGIVADIIVRFSAVEASEWDGACCLMLSSADKDGGFIRKQKIADSEFVSEYEAPLNGYSEFKASRERKIKFSERDPNDLSEDEYLIFKSRIVRDEKGNIVSANYGKIYGGFGYRFSRNQKLGAFSFIYYFNPIPNDRNLEFDGRNNLFLPQYKSSQYAP